MPGKKRPTKSAKTSATPVSPFKGEPGYLRSRLVRDPLKPGWLVLYDRAKGCPPGMDAIAWTESTRWVILWRPPPGTKAKVLFRALADEARGDQALTWAAKGVDQLDLWGGLKPPASDTPPPAPARDPLPTASAPAHDARTHGNPAAKAPGHDQSSPPEPSTIPKIPRPPPRGARGRETFSHEAIAEEALLRYLSIDEQMRLLTHIAQNATKSMLTNGELIDVEDYPTRLKALDTCKSLLVLAKDKREKEIVVEVLDDRHLYENALSSPELREELATMLAEFNRDGVVTTGIKGDPMVPP